MTGSEEDMRVVAVGWGVSPHRYEQSERLKAFAAYCSAKHHNVDRFLRQLGTFCDARRGGRPRPLVWLGKKRAGDPKVPALSSVRRRWR